MLDALPSCANLSAGIVRTPRCRAGRPSLQAQRRLHEVQSRAAVNSSRAATGRRGPYCDRLVSRVARFTNVESPTPARSRGSQTVAGTLKQWRKGGGARQQAETLAGMQRHPAIAHRCRDAPREARAARRRAASQSTSTNSPATTSSTPRIRRTASALSMLRSSADVICSTSKWKVMADEPVVFCPPDSELPLERLGVKVTVEAVFFLFSEQVAGGVR